MFKKFLKLLLIITSTVTILLWQLFLIEQHNNIINQSRSNLSGAYIQLGLPIKATTNKKYQKIVTAISKTSEQLKIPFLKMSSYKGHGLGSKKVNYAKRIDDTTFEVSNLNSSALANIFKIKLKNNNVYSTKKFKNSILLKKYGSNDFTIKKLNIASPPQTKEGLFYLQTQDIAKVKMFRKVLSKRLNNDFNIKLNETNFKIAEVPTLEQSNSINFRQLAITMTFFELVLILIYCLSISRVLGIYRLLGYSIIATLKQTVLLWLIIGSGIGFLLTAISEILNKHYEIIWPIFSLTIFITLVLSFIIFIIAILLKILPTSRLLIKRSYAKVTFAFLYIIKGILLTFILMSAIPLGELVYQYIITNTNNKSLVYSDYGVFFPSSIGYNQEDLINPENESKLLNNVIYPKINDQGGILIDTMAITGPNSSLKQQYQIVTINSNYLKFNPIYTSEGKKVKQADVIKIPTIMLKIKYKDNNHIKNKIKKYIQKDLKINNTKFIYIKNNQTIIDEIGKKIKNYGYIYVRSSLISNDYGNMFTGDGKDPLKVALHGKTPEKIYNELYPLLSKYNLSDNFPQLIRASDMQLNLLQQAEGNVLSNVISLLITVVIFITISVSLIYLYFSIFGRTCAIKQTTGISVYRSSGGLWLLWLSQIILTIIFTFSSNQVNHSSVILFFLALCMDLVTNLISLKIFAKNAVRGLLNE